VAIDDSGPLPEALAAALKSRVQALIVTPRAQNPTGAALDEERVRELRRVLCDYPDVLVFEDDHAGPVAGARAHTLCDAGRARWAVARSVSKSLGPDLRLAFLAGDATTIARVEGRTGIGMRWVSHLLQRLVLAVSRQRGIAQQLRRAERTYSERRSALIDALAAHGIDAHGRSGLNVWIPVPDEGEAIAGLLERGWAVTSGARFRIDTPPAIRICIARLAPADAESLADDLAQVLASTARSAPV
jgi:DNA-binding transcriptional MocR family regulator